jgi:hypothetical protein
LSATPNGKNHREARHWKCRLGRTMPRQKPGPIQATSQSPKP